MAAIILFNLILTPPKTLVAKAILPFTTESSKTQTPPVSVGPVRFRQEAKKVTGKLAVTAAVLHSHVNRRSIVGHGPMPGAKNRAKQNMGISAWLSRPNEPRGRRHKQPPPFDQD
jgi:hypothetical protein